MERDTVPFAVYSKKDDPLRKAFRNVDDMDWHRLQTWIPDGGSGRFWRAVFAEVRAALETDD